jgi:hypothetical protein
MLNQDRTTEVDVDLVPAHAQEASSTLPISVPRRRLLRALSGAVMGVAVLGVLSSCGGGDGEDGDEDEDDD